MKDLPSAGKDLRREIILLSLDMPSRSLPTVKRPEQGDSAANRRR